jgi:hypothetical protein
MATHPLILDLTEGVLGRQVGRRPARATLAAHHALFRYWRGPARHAPAAAAPAVLGGPL